MSLNRAVPPSGGRVENVSCLVDDKIDLLSTCALLETAQQLELAGFEELVEGSDLTVERLYKMATTSCYMVAKDALMHGLIGGVVT